MNGDIESPAAQAGWRSAGYRLLSILFRYPENPLSAGAVEEWLSAGFPDQPKLPKVESLPALQKEHVRIFHRGVTAMETAYVARDPFTKGNVIADIAGFYRAFGVDAAETQSGADTLEGELEFMAWMSAKEEHALLTGNLENAWVCHEAEGKFLREHLARWLPAFLIDFRATNPNDFFLAVAQMTEAFLRRELDREFSMTWEEVSRGIMALKDSTRGPSKVEQGEMDCPMAESPVETPPPPTLPGTTA